MNESEYDVAQQRLTAWIRDYGDQKEPIFIKDLSLILSAAKENYQLQRDKSDLTTILKDARKEIQILRDKQSEYEPLIRLRDAIVEAIVPTTKIETHSEPGWTLLADTNGVWAECPLKRKIEHQGSMSTSIGRNTS